jgi:hypothetical protein
MIRRIRAIIILALIWAVAWGVLGALLGAYRFYRGGSYAIIDPPIWAGPFWTVVLVFAIGFAKAGAVSGALFAIVLALAERNRSVAHLHLGKVTLWGIVGSLLIPGSIMMIQLAKYGTYLWFVATYLGLIGFAGGLSAAITLLVARPRPSSVTDAAA